MTADLDEILRAQQLLFEPGSVIELRVPHAGYGGTISGYYNDFGTLAKDAARLSGVAQCVYWTLNPVNPNLLARATNRFKERVRSTAQDRDILRRVSLLLDIDTE